MQTEAEKYLITLLAQLLARAKSAGRQAKIINLGAAKSNIVEEAAIKKSGIGRQDFICDRCDIQDCALDEPYVQKAFICSLEDMSVIPDGSYEAAFANFVFEHILDPQAAAREMARIIKSAGDLIMSLSNPQAPEFRLARLTPTWFHQFFRQAGHDEAYPIKYAYRNFSNLILIMANAGWKLKEERYLPATYSYLHSWPLINQLSRLYDFIVLKLGFKSLLGHAVLHWQKVDKS